MFLYCPANQNIFESVIKWLKNSIDCELHIAEIQKLLGMTNENRLPELRLYNRVATV